MTSGPPCGPLDPGPGRAVQQDNPEGPSDSSASYPGQLVNTDGHRTRAQSPGRAGRPHGPSGAGLNSQGQLVEPAGHRTQSRVPGTAAGTCSHRTQARFTREYWSTPQALGHKRESPKTAGRTQGLSDPGPSHPGHLFDPLGHRALSRVSQEHRSTSRALGHEPESSGTAGRPRGPSDASGRHLGKLFYTMGPRALS